MVAENVGNLQWAFQGAQGTPASAGIYASRLSGGSMPGGMGEDAEFEETTGAQMRSDRYVSERHAEGAPEFYVRPNVIASLLYGVLGSVSTTGASDPWSHEITPALVRPWMTFWRSQGALLYEESSDCKIDQLVIAGETGRPLTAAATVRGLRARHQTAEETGATIETLFPHVFYHGDGALQLEGSAVASFDQFQMTITRTGELIGGDGLLPIDNTEGLFTIETQLRRLWASTSLLNRKKYGGATPSNDAEMVDTILELGGTPSLDFKFTAGTAPERSTQLQLPRVALAPYDIPYGTGTNAVRESIVLDALQPSGDDAITATVLNSLDDLVSPS